MIPRPRPRRARRARRAVAVALVVAAGAACGGDAGGASAERFCGEIDEHRDQLTDPQITSAAGVDALLELYREIADLAPLAIEEEWRQLVSAYETASTFVPGDDESEQAALAAIYSSEEAAARVDRWLQENCGVDIGPVMTIVPHE